MKEDLPRQLKEVRCNCNGVSAAGFFEVQGQFLILRSEFGKRRVLIGLQEPRKLATRLLRNICLKATATETAAPCCTSAAKPAPPVGEPSKVTAEVV